MAPFLASPRRRPHIQMAHYSSICLCILHKIFIPMLNNWCAPYRCSSSFFFHNSPDLDRVKPFDADHSRVGPGNYFSPSILHLPLVLCGAPRSPALRCDFCLSRLSVWPPFSKFCAVKVTVCKCLNGSLIKTEGGISITKQKKLVSRAGWERGQTPQRAALTSIQPCGAHTFHPISQTPTAGCDLHISELSASSVYYLYSLKQKMSPVENNLNENKAKDWVPRGRRVGWVFF